MSLRGGMEPEASCRVGPLQAMKLTSDAKYRCHSLPPPRAMLLHNMLTSNPCHGRLPERASAGAVGYDLFSSQDITVSARCKHSHSSETFQRKG